MATSAAPQSGQQPRNFSSALRTGLIICALLLALLPIPVAALRLLPAYRIHARFLVFYAPLVCLLVLAYLLYVRDTLGRVMFADILSPLPEPYPYYRPSTLETLQRLARGLRSVLLALLPLILLATSFYCITRYTARLTQSVALATAAHERSLQLEQVGDSIARAADEVGAVGTPPAEKSGGRVRRAPGQRPEPRKSAGKASPSDTVPDTAIVRNPAAVREEVLRTAGVDTIPMFTELTVLYIGIFAAALMAVILMALKENAKEAMGLSEQDLLLGPSTTAESVDQNIPVVSDPLR
jgi:hypothetical protein